MPNGHNLRPFGIGLNSLSRGLGVQKAYWANHRMALVGATIVVHPEIGCGFGKCSLSLSGPFITSVYPHLSESLAYDMRTSALAL